MPPPAVYHKSMNRFFLLLCGIAALFPVAAQAQGNAELQRAQTERDKERARIQQAEAAAQKAAQREKGVLAEINRLDRKIDSARTQLIAAQRDISSVQSGIAAVQQEIEALEKLHKAHEERVGQRFRAKYKLAYRSGGAPFGVAMRGHLNGNGVGGPLTRLKYLSKIREKDQEILQGLIDSQQILDARKADLSERRAVLARQEQTVQEQKAALEKERKMRQSILAKARQDKAALEQLIREGEAAVRALDAMIRKLTNTSPTAPPAAKPVRTGAVSTAVSKLPWNPRTIGHTSKLELRGTYQAVMWPVSGTVISNFSRDLNGVSIQAEEGAPVKSIMSGTVEVADWYAGLGFGKLVCVYHGHNGLRTFYAHLRDIHVTEGQKVAKGALIGTVGNTGGLVDRPVLYFEMRRGFNAINWMRPRR